MDIVIGKIKDYRGRICEVVFDESCSEIIFRTKNPKYNKEKCEPEYIESIDFSATAIIDLANKLPDYADTIYKCIDKIRIW